VPDGEVCDDADNDCNGEVDDVAGVGDECGAGVGACAVVGQNVCNVDSGEVECDAIPGEPVEEVCDGEDNDCDGATDNEIPTVGDDCVSGQGICAVAGTLFCNPDAAEIQCDGIPGEPGDEVCDRLDNDCDGEVDNTGGPCADVVSGIREDVPEGAIVGRGWRRCYTGTYNQSGVDLAELLAECDGHDMLMACRPVEAQNFTLVAEGFRHEVLTDLGQERDVGHPHNGVNWYFATTWSWGFFPLDQPVNRFSCDVERGQGADLRMCWHTGNGNLNSGYRCGDNSLNGDQGWERVVYVRDAEACGDGNVDAGEQCDDGNRINEDGCDDACQLEAFCGNGELDGNEECDDGNNDNFDGCSAACVLERPNLVPGVQQDVPEASVLARGYRRCYQDLYNGPDVSLAGILEECGGTDMMIACRPVGEANLTLAAEGLRNEVIEDVGDGVNASHQHNGTTWYYSPGRSWGFAPANLPVNRTSCDFGNQEADDQRMCWHTGNGDLERGYRCGDNDLNGNANWERLIYVRSAPEECRNHTVINDPTRSRDNADGPVVCDQNNLDPGWYRFAGPGGTQLPTTAPARRRCGTHAPGWMNGAHPNVGDGVVDREVCYHWSDDECNWSNDIQVRNCGGYFVYNLVQPPVCSLRYCTANALDFAGIRENVAEAEMLGGGFDVCFSNLYNAELDEGAMVEACGGDVIALACRENGSDSFNVVAMGNRAEVLTPGAQQPGGLHEHNGTQWYFANNHSIGFIPVGEGISGGPCDVTAGPNRLCWHTQGSGGYRCGATTGLNNNANWERVVLQRGGAVSGP